MKEICREIITINNKDFVVRVQRAEADPSKYVPIVDWPNGKDITIGSCTKNYMGNTPDEAIKKITEALYSIGTLERL